MFNLALTSDDRLWLTHEHPSLNIDSSSGVIVISGPLKFDMVYEEDGNKFIVSPRIYIGNGVRIKDQYEIKIVLKKSDTSELPQVFETGLKIVAFAKAKNLSLSDLHINKDLSVCLCVAGKEGEYFPKGFSFKHFINQLVIPFFYAQSYFQKFNRWPWGEYSHGLLGIFEWYGETTSITKDEIEKLLNKIKTALDWKILAPKFVARNWVKGHTICLCKRHIKIRKCHPKALAGMWKFKKDLQELGVKV